MKKLQFFGLILTFLVLLVACKKDGDYYYLRADDDMPSYVVSEFKAQIAYNADDGVSYHSLMPMTWVFSWTYTERIKSAFRTKKVQRNKTWSGRIKIFDNGRVEFVD